MSGETGERGEMECGEARRLLDAYLDGELPVERSLALERHLAGCPDCARTLAARRALGTALREKLPYGAAPPALERAVREGLSRADRPARGRRGPPPWLRLVASFLLVAGLSASLTYLAVPRPGNSVPEEVLASHLRGMLSEGRMIDVASSDEHSVKPWFNTKLDFSPPVKDLAAEGYPLIGGRADYIGERRVAALVYGIRKHVVTLFIWPSTARTRGIETSARRGESLAHWADGAMNYWAVSDAGTEELAAFCRILQANERPD